MTPIITDPKQAYKILTENFVIRSVGGRTITKKDFTLTHDGVSSPNGFVLRSKIAHLPIKFNHVHSFALYWFHGTRDREAPVTSLDGCPSIVNDTFYIVGTNLTDLVGGPTKTGRYFVEKVGLTSLEGVPKTCDKISLDYLNIPLLRLLGINYTCKLNCFDEISLYGPNGPIEDNPGEIILLHGIRLIRNGAPIKQVLWECQKKLIAHGLDGIARW
jgi:hypothetical protein